MDTTVVLTIAVAVVSGLAIAMVCSHIMAYRAGRKEGVRNERSRWLGKLSLAWSEGLRDLFYRPLAWNAHKEMAEIGYSGGYDYTRWQAAHHVLRCLGFFEILDGDTCVAWVHTSEDFGSRFPFVVADRDSLGTDVPALVPRVWKASFLDEHGSEIDSQEFTCQRDACTQWDIMKLENAAEVVVFNPNGKPIAKQNPESDGTWGRPSY